MSPLAKGLSALLALSALALSSCAAGPGPTPSGSAAVEIDNCGVPLVVSAPPQRIVTIKSSTLELLLALGAGDRVVGTAYSDGPVPARFATAAARIPVISEKVPSQEAALALEPDMIFAGWESNLTPEGAGSRAALAALGVASYVAPSACKTPGYMPDPLDFEGVFRDFTEAGRVFGLEGPAADLVAQQRAQLAAITPDPRGLTALWYSSGKATPYVGAGIGAPQMIMKAAGLGNVFADVHDTWTSVSWEAVAAKDPSVIVLTDASWNTAKSKIDYLRQNPVTAELSAVKAGRFLVVDFPASEAGVRNVDAVASLVDQLGRVR